MLYAPNVSFESLIKKRQEYLAHYAALVPAHWSPERRKRVIDARASMLPSLWGTMFNAPSVARRLARLRKKCGITWQDTRQAELVDKATLLADRYANEIRQRALSQAEKLAKEQGLSEDERIEFSKAFLRWVGARLGGFPKYSHSLERWED